MPEQILYSQRDPRWASRTLGKTKLTVGGYGCFFMSLCTIYQADPDEMLKHTELWDRNGNIKSDDFAKLFGGAAVTPQPQPPKGWCIAETSRYAPQSPTHFFIVNMDARQEIDPLDLPARVESLSYDPKTFISYRPFMSAKLAVTETWQQQAQRWATESGIITQGWDKPDQPMSQVRTAAAMQALYKLLQR